MSFRERIQFSGAFLVFVYTGFLLILVVESALYEDDVGKQDWMIENVGKLKEAHFYSDSSSKKNIYVSTESNVLASLQMKTGNIEWRHVLPEENTIDRLFRGENYLISISSGGKILSGWDIDGNLLWEDRLPMTKSHCVMDCLFLENVLHDNEEEMVEEVVGEKLVAILLGNRVQLRSVCDGRLLWTSSPLFEEEEKEKSTVCLSHLARRAIPLDKEGNRDRNILIAIGFSSDNADANVIPVSTITPRVHENIEISRQLLYVEYDIRQGAILNRKSLVIPSELSGTLPELSVSGDLGLSLERGGTVLLLYHFGAEHLHSLPISEILPASIRSVQCVVALGKGLFVLRCMGDSSMQMQMQMMMMIVIRIVHSENGQFMVTLVSSQVVAQASNNNVLLLNPCTRDNDTYAAYLSLSQDNGLISLWVWSSSANLWTLYTLTTEGSHNIRPPYGRTILKAFMDVFPKRNGDPGFRVLLMFDDFCVQFFEESTSKPNQGLPGILPSLEIRWQREESLALIKKLQIVDMPNAYDPMISTFQHDANASILQQFVDRMRVQWGQLLSLFGISFEVPLERIHESPDFLHAAKDPFGFRKILVVSTEPGKLFGLLSETGEILWRTMIFNRTQDSTTTTTTATTTWIVHSQYLIRKASEYQPEAVVVCTASKGKKGTLLFWFNPLNGEPIKPLDLLPFQTLDTALLPKKDSIGTQSTLMLLDSDGLVHRIPNDDREEMLTLSDDFPHSESQGNFFYFIVNETSGLVEGFALGKPLSPSLYSLTPLWNISFPCGEERIVSLARMPTNEPIYSNTRILGDRSVLEKYLNPNLIALATVRNSSCEKAGCFESTVHIYLVDSVSGAILYHTFHPGSSAPVHMAFSENWLVYHYWSSGTHRFQLTVLELFEEQLDWSSQALISSFARRKPKVLQQTYVFPGEAKTLSITQTARGITSKQLLVGLGSDQILALGKALLDPRRPLKAHMKPEDREEGLFPYDSHLPLIYREMITYYRQVKALREIQTAAVHLESTVLVVAYGIDVFFTRLAPSGTFDMLDPAFNYAALIVTSVSLAVFTLISRYLARRKELARLWK